MKSTEIFTGKAEYYAASRPAYAPQAVEQIFLTMISENSATADIGSGTGILSYEFLQRGYDVYCVEPNEAMRAEAERRYSGDPHFHSVPFSAEHTGLEAESVSLVTAASAFHWFDPGAFRLECRRILRPHGIVCILTNGRIFDAFTQRQHLLCEQFCHGYTSLRHGVEKTVQRAADFFRGKYAEERFDFPLHYSKERFIARSLSSSYAPADHTAEYLAYTRALKRLLDEVFPNEDICIANETRMLWGRLE